MSFDAPIDAPYQITIEGAQIRINFERTGPNTAIISWTLPESIFGCEDDNNSYAAYDGIVITLNTSHATIDDRPVNGTVYEYDSTADRNLHSGDKIGSTLVVGAFYSDKQTTFVEVSGIQPNTPYYVQGYAVDEQLRYHFEGVHAYSQNYGNSDEPNESATQIINFGQEGVIGTDGTGLSATETYSFKLNIDGTEYTISINGADAGTYNDLINAINKQLSLLENPPMSPIALNSGRYYWDGENVYLWNGEQHILQENAYIEPNDPSILNNGVYWRVPSSNDIYRLTGSPSTWTLINELAYYKDPTDLDQTDYWYNGSTFYNWDGDTWCSLIAYIQSQDPSKYNPHPGSYWYATDTSVLYKWDADVSNWIETYAIMWDIDPNNLTNGTFWFDDTNNQLKQYNTGSPSTWVDINAFIQENEPTLPASGSYWYNPTTEILQQWVTSGSPSGWVEIDVIVWPDDPTDRESCDLWWNSLNDNLYVWNVVNSVWTQTTEFLQQANNPINGPTIELDSVWLDNTSWIAYKWDGSTWNVINYINFPDNPMQLSAGVVWRNTENNNIYEWDGSIWNEINPINSETDPQNIQNGVLWFDTTNNGLYERTGSSWVSIPYSTTSFTPSTGTLWFNTSNNTLYEWNETEWVTSTLLATAELNSDGNLLFTTGSTGSSSMIDFIDDRFLGFFNIKVTKGLSTNGSDGLSGKPMYAEIGVGDDGTTDERRELAHSIRAQLGYPVVDVELTPYQIDTAITGAIESYRKRSGHGYRRGFYFLDLVPGRQQYLLTSKEHGYDKIVDISQMQRFTSAFLSTAHGSGVYGQIVLQHLYNMGTYDLTSFHLVSQYVEQLEHLFATRIVFSWYEQQRTLLVHQAITRAERVLMDTSIERPEQEFFKDRWVKSWIERYALAQSRFMLGEIRGKYASLPGAGGGVALNAQDLINRAEVDMQECYNQLEDYIADRPEDFGMGSQFIIG